jgi:pilus assembly protein CpaF
MINSGASIEERLATAREELSARLGAEYPPERRILFNRGDLIKIVDAAIQAYFVRHAMDANPLQRRDLIISILETLTVPDAAEAGNRRNPHKAAIEAARAQVQPLVLQHISADAAAEMPRPAFEAQLTDWVKRHLAEAKIQLNFPEQRELIEVLIAEMLGLGPLDPLIADETVSAIMVNGPKQVFVKRRGILELTDVSFRDEQHLMSICTKIATRTGGRIDEARPIVDGRLSDGSRATIIMPPLAIDGISISIRKFPKKAITLDTMAANNSLSPAMARVLKIAALCRLNILISGNGTDSGKTTLLNALSLMIGNKERVVTIEDGAELQLPQPHVVRLKTRAALPTEEISEITVRDLLKTTLLMLPDRIIIGECRGAEALDIIEAMNAGHDGLMSTINANTPLDALTRLENMMGSAGANLPSRATRNLIASSVHLICQVNRMRDGARRVTRITEVVGVEGDTIATQDLFTFEFQGEGADGKLRGAYQSSGIRPAFLPRAEYFGFDRDLLEAMGLTSDDEQTRKESDSDRSESERPDAIQRSGRRSDSERSDAIPRSGVPFFITEGQKRALRERGLTDDEIRNMTPIEAHQLLGLSS